MSNEIIKKNRGSSHFSTEEKELGLLACVLCNGNSRRAAQFLASDDKQGFKVNQKTLWEWMNKDPQRYREIQLREMPRIRTRAADTWASLAELQGEVARKLTDRTLSELDKIPAERLSSATKDMVYSGAISTDKAREYRGEATVVVEHRDASEILRKLKGRGVVLDAEVVSEEDVPGIEAPNG